MHEAESELWDSCFARWFYFLGLSWFESNKIDRKRHVSAEVQEDYDMMQMQMLT